MRIVEDWSMMLFLMVIGVLGLHLVGVDVTPAIGAFVGDFRRFLGAPL